jgi:hypothetical protein
MLVTPLWNVWAPAMPDYPAHLASFALIEQGTFHRGAAIAPSLYHLQWGFVPNLASEILVPPLARLTGVAVATKLFLTAALFMWILGPGAIHRALYGRVGIAPLFGSFFAYNANFIWAELRHLRGLDCYRKAKRCRPPGGLHPRRHRALFLPHLRRRQPALDAGGFRIGAEFPP